VQGPNLAQNKAGLWTLAFIYGAEEKLTKYSNPAKKLAI
jgi:hypothetical protein